MTQKRGLGRGLGALIPGAGAPAKPASTPSAEEADASSATADPAPLTTRRQRVTSAGSAPSADAAPAEARGPRGGRNRPVDMFFSGDPVDGGDPEGIDVRPSRDLADDMAKAARERRRSGRAPSPKNGEKASAKSTAKSAAPKKSAETKATGGKSGAAKPSGTRSSGRKSAGAQDRPSTSPAQKAAPRESTKPTPSAAAPVPDPVEETAETARAAQSGREAAAAAPVSPSEDSPAVDVEPGHLYPARDPEEPAAASSDAPAEHGASKDRVDDSDDAPEGDQPSPHGAASEPAAPADGSPSQGLVPVPGAEFAEIPIDEIRENPRNPRTVFDEDALDELAYSLREVGVLQPVVVRSIRDAAEGENYELVMGERRWRAAQRAGLTAIPAIIRETTDDDLLRDALLENLHRSELNPLEEAAAYQQLLEDFNCTQDVLAERIGRSRPQISNTLRLLRLPAVVQRRVASGALSAGHARALLGLEDQGLMEELATRIVAEGLSVRQVEKLVATGAAPGQKPAPRRTTYHPQVVAYTSRLSTQLEAPVKIDMGKRKGRITLEFTDLQDLDRVMDRLGLLDD